MEWVLAVGGRILPGNWARITGDEHPGADLRRIALVLGAVLEFDGRNVRVRRKEHAFTWTPGDPWITAGSRRYTFSFDEFPSSVSPADASFHIPLAPVLAALNISWEIVRGERLIRVARPDVRLVARTVVLRRSPDSVSAGGAGPFARLARWLRLHGVRVWMNEGDGETASSQAPLAVFRWLPEDPGHGDRFTVYTPGGAPARHLAAWLGKELAWELGAKGSIAIGRDGSGNGRSPTVPVVYLNVHRTALRDAKRAPSVSGAEAVAVALFRAVRRLAEGGRSGETTLYRP